MRKEISRALTGPGDREAASPEAEAVSRLASYVKTQVERQDARKASLEARGAAVITTAGALVTLLFGVATLSLRDGDKVHLTAGSAGLMATALVLLILAALTAILANVPLPYEEASVEKLRSALRTKAASELTTFEAERRSAMNDLDVLRSAKDLNGGKARLLVWAFFLEVIAVALLGIAVGILISPWVLLGAALVTMVVIGALYLSAYGLRKPHDGPIAVILEEAMATVAMLFPARRR